MTQASGHPSSASSPLPTDSDKAVFLATCTPDPRRAVDLTAFVQTPYLPKPVSTTLIDSATLSVRPSLKPLKTKSLLSRSLFDFNPYYFLEASQSFSIQIV